MIIPRFKLAREIDASTEPADFTISASDCEPLSIGELLALAGEENPAIWSATSLGYSNSQGLPELRHEIARTYDDVDSDQVLVCAPQEVLYLTFQALLRSGDHVVSMFPAYQPLYQIAESIGCEVSRWEPDAGSDLRFTIDGLKRLLRPTTRLVVMNFPHNPTGYTPSAGEFREMIEAIDETGAAILSDEIYRDLAFGDTAPLQSAIDLSKRAIVLNGLSKSYGLGGLRIGWLVTREAKLLPQIMQYRDYTTQSNSSASEALARMVIRSRHEILERNCQRIRNNLRLFNEFAERWSEQLSLLPPVAGSLCLMQFEHLSADEFCRRALREHRIRAASMSLYDYGDRHVRIGLGREGLPMALERLNSLVQSMAGRQQHVRRSR